MSDDGAPEPAPAPVPAEPPHVALLRRLIARQEADIEFIRAMLAEMHRLARYDEGANVDTVKL